MKNELIKKYLNMRYNENIAYLLNVYVSNDCELTPKLHSDLARFGKKFVRKGNFDIYQFTYLAKNQIDRMLHNSSFRKRYYDLPSEIDLPTRYHVAYQIADYVACEYLCLSEKYRK